MNRRMPNGTYGGVRGRGREAPAYSIGTATAKLPGSNSTCGTRNREKWVPVLSDR